jgi:hypothetical protein
MRRVLRSPAWTWAKVVLCLVGIGTEQALALSILLGFTMPANGVIGVLPLMFGGQRYWAGRMPYLQPSEAADHTL